MRLDGPDGNGEVKVTHEQKLTTEAETAPRDYFVSKDHGQVYTVQSEDAATAADEETLYLKNTSTDKTIIIDDIICAADAEYRFRVKFVTNTSAPSGTALIPTNLNRTSSHAAEATCQGDGAVSNLIDGGDIALATCPVAGTVVLQFEEALRLGQNDAIAIESESIANVALTVEFHFEED